jgi:hypothetical protein
MLRRRSVTARSGIVAAAIGVLAITSLAGASVVSPSALSGASAATASVSASQSSSASVSEGDTTCVPWPKPTSLGLKCTGTYSGNTAWNPWTQQNISEQPVVTVSQAKDLTDQDITVSWSGFTPTIGNTYFEPNPTTDADFLFQVPIFECNGTAPDISDGYNTQCYMLPVGTGATVAKTGPPNGVLGDTLDTSAPPPALPTNTKCGVNFTTNSPLYQYVYNPTECAAPFQGGDPSTWVGQADFHVEAPTPRSKGGFFNCSSTSPCSLVVDPNWGGVPAEGTKPADCSSHAPGGGLPFGDKKPYPLNGDFIGNGGTGHSGYAESYSLAQAPGQGTTGSPASLTPANTTVQDYSCWTADRIVIPLSFEPTPNDCPNKTPEFYALGSPMMQTQMLQWQAGWCNGRAPVTLNYTSNSESVARELFLAAGQSGGARTDMALVTLPATAAQQSASQRQFTYAPLANSGAGIAYYIDDGITGTQINRMVLDSRLLAKLITQSYTLAYGCTAADHTNPSITCDPAVWGTGKNPYSLYDDREFLSLNSHCEPFGAPADYTCSNASDGAVTVPPTDDFPTDNNSSASTALGAFLPTVLGPDDDMTYDLSGWIAANPDAAAFLQGQADPSGMHVNTNYLNVSYPTQALPVLDNGYTVSIKCSTETGCPSGVPDVTMQATWNPQQDLDTIALDLLTSQPTAFSNVDSCPATGKGCTNPDELVTTSAMNPQQPGNLDLLSELDLGDIAGYEFPAAELVNGAGVAVGPTQASVEAAVNVMKTNPDGITQYFDFASKEAAAYPLAMVDYAMVPTCGLSHSEASAIADFLTKAATTGQIQGEAPGDLAPGYYPLTAKQKAQTLKAAQEVQKQTCKSPPADHSVDGNSSAGDTGAATSTGKTPAGGDRSPSDSPSSIRQAKTAAFGQKSADSGLAGLLLVLAIIVGVLLVLGGPTAWVITVTGRWPVVLHSVRVVPARLQTGLGRLAGLVIRRS